MNKIDIRDLTLGEVLNVAGHDRGLAARDKFELETLDATPDSIDVLFPADFRQVSSSFFQGMFSSSVRKFGSVASFFDHYRFDAPAHIRAKLADYAKQVLDRGDY